MFIIWKLRTMLLMPLLPLNAALVVHIALAIPAGALPPASLAAAIGEAAAIWRPYGVVVDAGDPCNMPADDTLVLTVTLAHRPLAAAPAWHPPLGAVAFTDGVPQPAITLLVDEIFQLVTNARLYGTSELVWPVALRERIAGRVIGRVLAHEIGHYLLRDPRHATTGLMQPVYLADDLVTPQRNRFVLSSEAVARLPWMAGNEKGPARAGPATRTIVRK